MMQADPEQINRQTWNRAAAAYARLTELMPAEQRILERMASELRGAAVLDLGVGAGRTTPHLLALDVGRYVGVDLSPRMVAAARERHPGVEFREMDACDLSALSSNTFRMALFSYNGIDCVTDANRRRVLAEVFRVLEPGGAFVFSCHNLAWLAARNGGAAAPPFELPSFEPTLDPLRLLRRTARFAVSLAVSVRNRAKLAAWQEQGEGYALLNDSGEHYGTLMYYVSIATQRHQSCEAGFERVQVFNLDGSRAEDTSTDYWMHFVARKPQQPSRAATPELDAVVS
jgi:SAM-dependent methyltransferase